MDILVTGARDSGKTALIRAIAKATPGCAGIYTEAEMIAGKKSSYFAVSAATGERRHLLDLSPKGPVVDREGFAFACAALEAAASAPIMIIDEFGPLEAAGKGFMPALRKALPGHKGKRIISSRNSLILTVINTFHLADFELIDMDLTTVEAATGLAQCLLK